MDGSHVHVLERASCNRYNFGKFGHQMTSGCYCVFGAFATRQWAGEPFFDCGAPDRPLARFGAIGIPTPPSVENREFILNMSMY